MKKLTTIFALIFMIIFASSCKNEASLQSYLVDTSGKEGFYTGDLPVSSVLSPKAEVSDEIRKTIKSIKKINIAFLPKTADNSVMYETEKAKLKTIFKTDSYKSLMSMKAKGMNVNVYYSGNTEAVDEVIAFGYGEKAGVGVARLLGDNMNPAMIIDMMQNIDLDADKMDLGKFSAIFKEK